MNSKKQWKKTTATKYRKDWNLDSDKKNYKETYMLKKNVMKTVDRNHNNVN